MDTNSYLPFLISLGLGLLVGLQREWRGTDIAGIRTFPLITLLGTMMATVGGDDFVWSSGAGFLGVALLLVVGNIAKLKSDEKVTGLTTEMAAMLMYGVGVALAVGIVGPAIVTAGVTAVLLHWKQSLHQLVRRIGEKDFRGLIQLVLIALVILPLLPNETFGPYNVLNPFKIWTMVVLIVGISLAAYVAYKVIGTSMGAILGGLLGGLISSTATTVSYARQAKENASLAPLAGMVILVASTVVNARVLIELGVVSPGLLRLAAMPLGCMMLLMIAECGMVYFFVRRSDASFPDHDNPAQLKPALIFAALYAVILFAVAWAKDQFGTGALYGVALISGLTDVDAITLSTANLFSQDRVSGEVAWRVVLVAILSNLFFKGAAVAFLGNRTLLKYVAITFGVALAGGLALLFFWPDVASPR